MKIGDLVSVIDENLKGKITSVKGNTIVFIDEYGFTYQYEKEKLISHEPHLYENMTIENKYEYTKIISKKHKKNHLVLDLHFNKLVKNTSDYDSFERLFMQKEKLLETLTFCEKNKIKKLEIIHGIGDGIVQKMVHDVLESRTYIDFYNTAVLKEDSGSIMVIF